AGNVPDAREDREAPPTTEAQSPLGLAERPAAARTRQRVPHAVSGLHIPRPHVTRNDRAAVAQVVELSPIVVVTWTARLSDSARRPALVAGHPLSEVP